MADKMEEKVNDSLVDFIDFLYVVVFGLIVAEMFPQVLMVEEKTLWQKSGSLVMLISAFYFLAWDWLHGRLLTLKNHYTRYSRFFLEILIAACAYGTAFAALRGSIYILIFLGTLLMLGSLWAKVTLLEYPDSQDKNELKLIQWYQLVASIVVQGIFVILYLTFGPQINNKEGGIILVGGWFFVLCYEVQLERKAKGILSGPGVPFLKTKHVEKIQQKISALRAQKGD